jgi:hypothetical protein
VDRVKLELFTLGSQKVKVGTRDLVSGILNLRLLFILFNPVITTFLLSLPRCTRCMTEQKQCGVDLVCFHTNESSLSPEYLRVPLKRESRYERNNIKELIKLR